MNNRKILKYHSISGLWAGIFLILMGLSGAILVFQHDIEQALWDRYIQVDQYTSLNYDKAIDSVQYHYPGWDTRLIHFKKEEAFIFNLRKPTQRLFVFVHPSTGQIIKEINELTTFTRWLLKFHYSFQAGLLGRILVLMTGFLFLFSLVSGVILYRKSLIKTLLFRTKIKRHNSRSYYSSLHRIVGVWSLFFNAILLITGLFLSWSVVAAALKSPVASSVPEVSAPVAEVLQDIAATDPDFTPTYIRLPTSRQGNLVVYGKYADDAFFHSEFYNSFRADYQTGEIIAKVKVQESDLWTKFNSSLLPLHFGQYGGMLTKLLYCLTGLAGPFLSISGFWIWLKTRRKK